VAAQENQFDAIQETLKRTAAILRDAEIPFLVGGGMAAWARGGPESNKDLDLVIRPGDADAALAALAEAGMRAERPPEEWLVKAWDGEILVDLIFGPVGISDVEELFERAEELTVLSMEMEVMAVDDVMVTKLLALDEHALDYASLLATARALREQIVWADVQSRTEHSPYARAFFTLVTGLGIVEANGAQGPAGPAAALSDAP
jgi:hypothetical protein